MEVELQYLYTGVGAPCIPTALASLPLSTSEHFVLVDRYFDTEKLTLRRTGNSLRARVADNDPRPRLTWKGPSRSDGRRAAKRRYETEVSIDCIPEDGAAVVRLLQEHGLWDNVRKAADLGDEPDLHSIGELRNRRSTHTYVHGLHRLELSWDHLEYPIGPDEVRLEVELKSKLAKRYLEQADEDLRMLFGSDLAAAERGKVRELCERLYPEIVAA
jgi:uncharacterized protein YjbK